jgi:hypothetical protein
MKSITSCNVGTGKIRVRQRWQTRRTRSTAEQDARSRLKQMWNREAEEDTRGQVPDATSDRRSSSSASWYRSKPPEQLLHVLVPLETT